jgi:lipoyl(octanoyl) transferase
VKPARTIDLGRREYREVWTLQQELVAQRQRGEIVDTLVLVEHPDVITLGRRLTSPANVLTPGDIPVVEIERGGDVTYHGPGQLVGYPILALDGDERDLHAYLRNLEEALIGVCADVGLTAGRKAGWTGVWIPGEPSGARREGSSAAPPRETPVSIDRKVASLGIAVRKWVTMHGFALNVATDLSRFTAINPCGLDAAVMTSLSRECGRDVGLDEVKPLAVARLSSALGRAF